LLVNEKKSNYISQPVLTKSILSMKIKSYRNIIISVYKNFNNRNINDVLSLMSNDVLWPNAWEGGFVKGHPEVRDYCTRQWKSINPTVEPVAMKAKEKDKYEVVVHQVVKDLTGKTISDGIVKHIYQFENGLIKSMEIEEI
jgi:SnoaL-like domain